jgi:hypothetical protein
MSRIQGAAGDSAPQVAIAGVEATNRENPMVTQGFSWAKRAYYIPPENPGHGGHMLRMTWNVLLNAGVEVHSAEAKVSKYKVDIDDDGCVDDPCPCLQSGTPIIPF